MCAKFSFIFLLFSLKYQTASLSLFLSILLFVRDGQMQCISHHSLLEKKHMSNNENETYFWVDLNYRPFRKQEAIQK